MFGTLLSFLPAIQILERFDDDNNSMMAIPTASAQFIIPEEDDSGNQNTSTSTSSSTQNITSSSPPSSSSLLLRGLIGSMIIASSSTTTNQNANGTTDITDDYIVVGRWRMLVNESLVQRFAANLTVARVDGSEYHNNIIIESIGRPSEFAGNASNIMTQISTDSSVPGEVIPLRLEIKDRVLEIADINIDENTVEDQELGNILSIIDGQSIFGIVEFQGTGS
ncbi:hypothetical protein Ngar_c34060 [Candidatus Nitrososphaera gargensis Ga9.2]|uniref:Uncharacterized protein n=1 Tax=Nitrososphaera gargensis (strain Ga9.2) TaxID=1237085 RepID=K0IFZ2_NITGG|nr:hypothetical protein [Candidatus Nitrososphaera gargensis]AFU60321.1 hypothetical protein Ngar_c34060 [Candidatus Nitrososphaera gargensis Ga9.2]